MCSSDLARVIRKVFLPLITALTNEPPLRRGGIPTRSLARMGIKEFAQIVDGYL